MHVAGLQPKLSVTFSITGRPLHLVGTLLPPHAVGRVLLATTHSHVLPERTPVLRRGWIRLL